MSILLSVIVFSILVIFHELGHFLLAKKNGIGVKEFSVGFGPRLVGFKKGETDYCWRLVPFGGACVMVGEDEESEKENAFGKRSVWARISVVAAGPIFNFILAVVLAIVVIGMEGYDECVVSEVREGSGAWEAGLREGDVIQKYDGKKIVISRDLWLYQYMNEVTNEPIDISYLRDGSQYDISMPTTNRYLMGITYNSTEDACTLTGIQKGSAADEAGIQPGDVVTSLNGTRISSGEELHQFFETNPLDGSEISFEVERDGTTQQLHLTPRQSYDTGFYYSMGRVKASPLKTLRYSLTELRYNIESTLKSFLMLFTGKLSKDDVSGPVGIVNIVSDTYEQAKPDGFRYVFLNIANLLVLLSVNLGVLNLFPFPALDGGRLVFLFLEVIRRKPVPKEKEAIVHLVGMVLLMILMVYIVFNDVGKLLR